MEPAGFDADHRYEPPDNQSGPDLAITPSPYGSGSLEAVNQRKTVNQAETVEPPGPLPPLVTTGQEAGGDHAPHLVLAFGGVIWQVVGDAGELQVAVVHRPRYDDWSFPKGKAEDGETPAGTARREVEEETGFRCRIGAELGTVQYQLPDGRIKVVGFWAMEVVDRRHRPPDAEVDAVAWWPVSMAERQLSHFQDVDILRRFLDSREIRPGHGSPALGLAPGHPPTP